MNNKDTKKISTEDVEVLEALEDNGFKGNEKTPISKTKIYLLSSAVLGLVIVFLFVNTPTKDTKKIINENETFDTKVFSPPSLLTNIETPEQNTNDDTLKIPEPETTTFDVPPPPVTVVQDKPKEEEIPSRYKSSMIVLDSSNKQSASQPDNKNNGQSSSKDKNIAFLNDASNRIEKTISAKKIDRIDAVITEGTLIPAILETAINSDLAGQIRAIVAEDVYSFDGRRVLIPSGTRLIGEYQSDIMTGQTRVFVVWTRLIRDDGISVRFGSIGTDSLGRSGVTGHIDKKFREKFTSSILLSVVGAGSSYAIGTSTNKKTYRSNDTDGADLARQTIAETFSSMANTALSDNLRIPPTITINQGEKIFVYVREDLDFSDFYQDPVTEAMQQIKKERKWQ